jgi:hypothetical protein
LEPFHDIGPVVVQSGVTTYPELAVVTGNDNSAPPCQDGKTFMRFPISTEAYDIEGQRSVFDAFNDFTKDEPAFNESLFLFEGYSVQGVKAVPSEKSAFPHRMDNLLM